MSLKNTLYILGGLTLASLGFYENELMHQREQEYISEYLDTQDRITHNTMQEAESHAADRNAFNGLTSILSLASGVGLIAMSTLGNSRKDLKTNYNN